MFWEASLNIMIGAPNTQGLSVTTLPKGYSMHTIPVMSPDHTAPAKSPPQIHVALVDGPVKTVPLDWPSNCGGESSFLGRTRVDTHPEFGDLVRLEYEAFGPMARTLMQQMAEEAAGRFGCHCIRMVHSRGAVEPGQASVVIQVAAPHRGEAFAACRHLIDTLKHELPIWKREIWQRGETFVEGCCAHRIGVNKGPIDA